MTVQNWRLLMNSGYKQLVGPTIFMIFGPNMSSNVIKPYIDGF